MTGLGGLAARRAAAGRGPLVTLGLLTALVVACVVGMLGQVEHGAARAVRDASELAGDGARLALRTRLAPDAAAQDALVRALVADAARGGRVAVARTETPDGSDTPFVTWTLTADPAALTADDVARLAAGLPGLEGALKASEANVRGVVADGGLVGAAAALDARLAAFRRVAVVPLLVLAVVGVVGLGRVARQVVAGRRGEDALLAARGVARRQVCLLAAAEAVVVTLLGALAGAGGALALLRAGTGADVPAAHVAAVVVGTVVVAAGTVTVLADRQQAEIARREPRGTLAAGPVVAAAVLGAAGALAAWRVVGTRGTAVPDALATAAPGVLLVVLVLLGVQALGPALALAARRAARGRPLDGVLALRSVARRADVRPPALVTGLAVATLVLASVAVATATDAGVHRATLDAGADLRVTVAPSGPLAGPDVDPAPGLAAGARAATPVVVRGGKVGADDVTVLAAPTRALDEVVRDVRPFAPLLAPPALDGQAAEPAVPAPPAVDGQGAGPAASEVPGVVDAAFAAMFDARAGSGVPLTVGGTTLTVRIAEVRDRLPGVPAPAVLLDAGAARAAQAAAGGAPMASEQVWLRTDADAAGAPAAARALADRLVAAGAWGVPAAAAVATQAPHGTEVAPVLWTAALAAVALALAGLRSTTVAQAAAREGETVALRALGLAPARQARLRVREAAIVLGAGAGVGALAGAVVAVVAAPLLVAAATGVTGGADLVLDVAPLLGGLAVLALGAGVLVGLHARTVARQAADLDLREVSA